MKDCLIFVWVEKEYLVDVVNHLESIGMRFVESIVWTPLQKDVIEDEANIEGLYNEKDGVNLEKFYLREEGAVLSKSKLNILMFRYVSPYVK